MPYPSQPGANPTLPPDRDRRPGKAALRQELARQGVRSAIEICRTGGDDPISIMVGASRFFNTVAAAFAPRAGANATAEEIRAAIIAVPDKDLEKMRRFLMDAATTARFAAEFGYAKLQRVQHVGDAPSGPRTNRIDVYLKIGDDSDRGQLIDARAAETASKVVSGD